MQHVTVESSFEGLSPYPSKLYSIVACCINENWAFSVYEGGCDLVLPPFGMESLVSTITTVNLSSFLTGQVDATCNSGI